MRLEVGGTVVQFGEHFAGSSVMTRPSCEPVLTIDLVGFEVRVEQPAPARPAFVATSPYGPKPAAPAGGPSP